MGCCAFYLLHSWIACFDLCVLVVTVNGVFECCVILVGDVLGCFVGSVQIRSGFRFIVCFFDLWVVLLAVDLCWLVGYWLV